MPKFKDRRRKHYHYKVVITYTDGEKFARVYPDRERAQKFADREKRSPVVRSTRMTKTL